MKLLLATVVPFPSQVGGSIMRGEIKAEAGQGFLDVIRGAMAFDAADAPSPSAAVNM